MRTTIIPAQITTVEDKIAGNLNLTQILILMAPIFWTALVYTVFAPSLRLVWYKIPLILFVLFACLILSLRIREKLVIHWLSILLTYNLRPKYYLFNKNNSYLRDLHLPVFKKENNKLLKPETIKKETHQITPLFDVTKLLTFETIIGNPKYSIRYTSKKGGINVAFKQIKQ
ncbi:hypothetical protein BH09PAT2_BH09PAT2_08340 [soil metagenome]